MDAIRGILLDKKEVEMAYHGLLHFKDSLDKYHNWLRDPNYNPLPGFEEAILQVKADAAKYQELISKIYTGCFVPE